MHVTWEVEYVIEPNIEIVPSPKSIPALHLRLIYAPSGQLKGAVHAVTIASPGSADVAFSASGDALATFWEALRYNARLPLEIRATNATGPGFVTAVATVAAGWVSGATKPLPDVAKLRAAPPQLATWLHLANTALHAPDDVHALRDYAIILEQALGRPSGSGDPAAGVGYVRDFVSHPTVERKPVVGFLQKELGSNAKRFQYDPRNTSHRKLVRHYRGEAKRLVGEVLAQYV